MTGFPEMLDGRVKTMHPKITGAILAIRDNAEHAAALAEHGIEPIDMVVVNLYRFEKIAAKADATLEELIENIDIGGPTMIRSAAKNWQDVAIVTSPADYAPILAELRATGALSRETKWRLAQQGIPHHRRLRPRHQRSPGARWTPSPSRCPPMLDIRAPRRMDLRYGENPHQQAALYAAGRPASPAPNNSTARNFPTTTWWISMPAGNWSASFEAPPPPSSSTPIRAGCAEQRVAGRSYRKALECDPGFGIRRRDRLQPRSGRRNRGRSRRRLFVEAIAAPDHSPKRAGNSAGEEESPAGARGASADALVVKSISGGYLAQTVDNATFDRAHCRSQNRTRTQPTKNGLRSNSRWKVVKHVKSNAIVYARAGQTVAVGAGQMSRVDSVNIAAMKAHSAAGRNAWWPPTPISPSPTASKKPPNTEPPPSSSPAVPSATPK